LKENIRNIPLTNIILCGGSGKRLWPLSRENYPKQFIDTIDEPTLFQQTLQRNNFSSFFENFTQTIIASEDHKFILKNQLLTNNFEQMIHLEPMQKNTSPAILLASNNVFLKNKDAVVLITPSDHYIKDMRSYQETILLAVSEVSNYGGICLFGIKPDCNSSNYGHILVDDAASTGILNIEGFIEKPNSNKIQSLIENKSSFFWNSGIFVARLEELIGLFNKFSKNNYELIKQLITPVKKEKNYFYYDHKEYSKLESISFDNDIIENLKNTNINKKIIPLNFSWTDLGSFKTIYKEFRDHTSNNLLSKNVIAYKTNNSYIKALKKPIVTMGMSQAIIIDHNDILFVTNFEYESEMRDLINEIDKSDFKNHLLDSNKVYRPWGTFEILGSGDGFAVKKIILDPLQKISMQFHKFRSEHWIVISGTAEVTIGDSINIVNQNESIFIKPEEIHRLYNPSEENSLIIIEIQTGSIIDESDITRLEDIYGR
jgi:mannose-1-phosphate guanylyltransferase/mannose-6-phosphate isomerase